MRVICRFLIKHQFYVTIGVVRKTSRRVLSPTLRTRIWERYDCTKNVSVVAAHFKQHYSTMSSLINRLKKQDTLDFYTQPRPALPKKTTDRQDRALVRYEVANPRCSLMLLATPSKSSVKLGQNTIRKILKAYSKSKRVPRKKPLLRAENIIKRLSWTRVEKKKKRNWRTVC